MLETRPNQVCEENNEAAQRQEQAFERELDEQHQYPQYQRRECGARAAGAATEELKSSMSFSTAVRLEQARNVFMVIFLRDVQRRLPVNVCLVHVGALID